MFGCIRHEVCRLTDEYWCCVCVGLWMTRKKKKKTELDVKSQQTDLSSIVFSKIFFLLFRPSRFLQKKKKKKRERKNGQGNSGLFSLLEVNFFLVICWFYIVWSGCHFICIKFVETFQFLFLFFLLWLLFCFFLFSMSFCNVGKFIGQFRLVSFSL